MTTPAAAPAPNNGTHYSGSMQPLKPALSPRGRPRHKALKPLSTQLPAPQPQQQKQPPAPQPRPLIERNVAPGQTLVISVDSLTALMAQQVNDKKELIARAKAQQLSVARLASPRQSVDGSPSPSPSASARTPSGIGLGFGFNALRNMGLAAPKTTNDRKVNSPAKKYERKTQTTDRKVSAKAGKVLGVPAKALQILETGGGQKKPKAPHPPAAHLTGLSH